MSDNTPKNQKESLPEEQVSDNFDNIGKMGSIPQNTNMNTYGYNQGMGNYYFNNYNPKFYPQPNFSNVQSGFNANNLNNGPRGYNPQNPYNNNFFPKFKPQAQFYPNQTNPNSNKNFEINEEYNVIQSLKYVSDNYPNLISLNNNNLGLTENVRAQANPRFFVIKSFTEEDIHKSIKYNCWSSTKEGNKKLNIAFEDCRKKNSDLFFFFSMNASGRFVGVARMNGRVDESAIFEYWAMDEVWRGLMPVDWLIVKDIPNRFLKDIKLR